MDQETLLLESLEKEAIVQRRTLLPTWIKIFVWLFMIFGAIAVLGYIAGLFSSRFTASLYGLESSDPLSTAGIFICFLFALKGITAWGLWTEKNWAVDVGIADAVLGIIVCFAVMALSLVRSDFKIRLELALLIPYLIQLLKIRLPWKQC